MARGCGSPAVVIPRRHPPGVKKPAVVRMRGVLDGGIMEFLRRNQRPRPDVFPDVKENVDGCSTAYVVPCVVMGKGLASRRLLFLGRIVRVR